MKANKFFVLVLLALTLTLQTAPKASSISKLEEDKPATALYAIDFVNETIGFTCGSIGILLKTTDGGENWNILEWEESGNMSVELFDISFVDENNGWIAGAYMNPSNGFGFIMHTNDSGLTWDYQYTRDLWTIESIDMCNSTFGYAAGSYYMKGYPQEVFYRTMDGENWTLDYEYVYPGWRVNDIQVFNPNDTTPGNHNYLWAAATEGRIWYKPLPLDYMYMFVYVFQYIHFEAIHMLNMTDGYLVSANGEVWSLSCRHGWHYGKIHHFVGKTLSDVKFYNKTLGWVTTYTGEIYITTDAGLTWNLDYLVTGTEPCLRALDVTHSTPKVWVVGGQTAKAFGGRADLATIVHKSSPWETQLCPNMKFELPYNETIYNVYMEADSTLTNFAYNMTGDTFYFKVFGPDTCTGCCNITVPKEIVKGNIQVNIDGTTILDATITDNATHYFVSITYHHSIHDINFDMNYWMKPDLNHDNIIDIYDVVMVTGIYDSREGDPNFNATRDLYTDGIINIYDVVQVTGRYGETL